jgi:hypothetical protein
MLRRSRDQWIAEEIITDLIRWARQGFVNIAAELRRALGLLNQRRRSSRGVTEDNPAYAPALR